MNINSQGYLDRLRERRAEIQAQKESILPLPTLTERIETWWRGLTPEEQGKHYTMQFFQWMFGENPAWIGPVLFSLGWERKRLWKIGKPHSRVWVGPANY